LVCGHVADRTARCDARRHRLHSDNARRQIVQKIQQVMPLKPLAKDNRPCLVQPRKAANGLAKIYAQNLDVHRMLLSYANPAKIAAGRWEGSSSH
tara:strand:+ start:270 stop:554 length:285 start_codon:yes stop_codon:yes gene_type:complete